MRLELSIGLRIVSVASRDRRHPNHPFRWASKNLWCFTCTGNCELCGDTCCAVNRQLEVALDKDQPEKARVRAVERASYICRHNGLGPDLASTFLRCSSGCGRVVCPECCGVCPEALCQDLLCRECKSDPWASCDWH